MACFVQPELSLIGRQVEKPNKARVNTRLKMSALLIVI